MLSIVTTCKDRLFHLKKTLPLMCQQSDAEVIVVDYDCSQGTASWAIENFPKVRTLKITKQPIFSSSKAKNLGAKYAVGSILFFCDADVALSGDLGGWLLKNFQQGAYYIAEVPHLAELYGVLACSALDFRLIGGFDEVFKGWGGEDKELRDRLERCGLEPKSIPLSFLKPIPHSDDIRQIGFSNGFLESKLASLKVSSLYRSIKEDLVNLMREELSEQFRIQIYNQISDSVRRGEDSIELSIDLIRDKNKATPFERRFIYRLL